MPNSKQESRREAAERIVRNTYGEIVLSDRKRLADAIEAALKERDERAAKIADNHHPCQDGCYCGSDIADTIRNEDTNA